MPPTNDYFDVRSDRVGVPRDPAQPGEVRFPSWDNVTASLNAFVPGVKKSRPELFAASKAGGGMPMQEHGRKSVAMITKTQFPEDPSRDLSVNQLAKELMSIRIDPTGDARAVMNFVIDPKPQEAPTLEQLAAREAATKHDRIGQIIGNGSNEPWFPNVDAMVRGSVANVEAQGLKRRYEAAPQEASTVETPTAMDTFFRGLFAPSTKTGRETRALFTAPPVERGQGDVHDWVATSVFKVDRQAEQSRRQKDQEEDVLVSQSRRHQVEEAAAAARRVEEVRAKDRENHQALLASQRTQEQEEEHKRMLARQEQEGQRLEVLHAHQEETRLYKLRIQAVDKQERKAREEEDTRRAAEDAAHRAIQAEQKRDLAASHEQQKQELLRAHAIQAQGVKDVAEGAARARAAAQQQQQQQKAAQQQSVQQQQQPGARQAVQQPAPHTPNPAAAPQPRGAQQQGGGGALKPGGAPPQQQGGAPPPPPQQQQQQQQQQLGARLGGQEVVGQEVRKVVMPPTIRSLAGEIKVTGFVDDPNVHCSVGHPDDVVYVRGCSGGAGGVTRVFVHGACRSLEVHACSKIILLADEVTESVKVRGCDEVRIALGKALPPTIQVGDSPETRIHASKAHASATVEMVGGSPGSAMVLALSEAGGAMAPTAMMGPSEIMRAPDCFETPLVDAGTHHLQAGVVQALSLALSTQSSSITSAPPAPHQLAHPDVAPAGPPSRSAAPVLPASQQGQQRPRGPTAQVVVELSEHLQTLVGQGAMRVRFQDQLCRDLAASLHSTPERFEVQSLENSSEGGVAAAILITPGDPSADGRTAPQLAAQLVAMSRDPSSSLRSQPTLMQLAKVEDLSVQPLASASAVSPPVSRGSSSPGAAAGVGFIFEIPAGKLPLITKITPGGPADVSGFVKVGDSIVEIDGKSAGGLTTKQVSMLVVGIAGSMVRFKLQGPDARLRTASLTRRKVAAVSAALSSAAGMISESFKSPAYKPTTKKFGAPVSTFEETYSRKSMANTSMNTSALANTSASDTAANEADTDPLGRAPQHSPGAALTPGQQDVEAKLRAELARAERESQAHRQTPEQKLRAEVRAAEQRSAQKPGLSPPTSARTGSAAPTGGGGGAVDPQAQRQRQMMQHKHAAITPARPPQPGAPKVTATVISARNLPVTDKYNVPSPYIIMAIGNAFHKTAQVEKALDPEWGQSFDFPVQPALLQGQLLTLTVEDYSAVLRDEPIGQLSIPLLQLMMRNEWDGWFDLRASKSTQPSKGTPAVHLKLQYHPGTQGGE